MSKYVLYKGWQLIREDLFESFFREKNIKEAECINRKPNMEFNLNDNLSEDIDEPLVKIIERLNKLNIKSFASHANNECIGKDAYIKIDGKSVSEFNKTQLQAIQGANKGCRVYKDKEGLVSTVILKVPVTENTTYGDIEDGFMRMIEPLKIQDVPLVDRGIAFSVIQHQVASAWKCKPEDIDESCNKVTIAQFVKHDGIWYRSEDTYQRHINYLNSLEKHQDTQTQQEIESK